MNATTLTQFRNEIWDALPAKKHMAGKEKIFDVISILIQDWPDKEFAESKRSQAKAIRTALRLNGTVKRQMHLMYGEQEFGTLWLLALNILVSTVIRLVLEWWLKKRENRELMAKWQQRKSKER